MTESPLRPLFAVSRRVPVGRSFVMPGKDQYDKKHGLRARPERPRAEVSESPQARQARIERLRIEIANGTYRPDLEKVAERMLPELFDK